MSAYDPKRNRVEARGALCKPPAALPKTAQLWTLTGTTDGKHLRAKMHIYGPLCEYDGLWFSPRRHRPLVSYRDRNRRPPV